MTAAFRLLVQWHCSINNYSHNSNNDNKLSFICHGCHLIINSMLEEFEFIKMLYMLI